MSSDRERVERALAAVHDAHSSWVCRAATPEDTAFFKQPEDERDGGRLVWDQDEHARAFDASGKLKRPLSFRFASSPGNGGRHRVQTGFAQAGLAPEIPRKPAYRGAFTVSRGDGLSTDLVRLCHAFAALEAEGWFARPCHRMMTSYGWEDAHERGKADRALFWNFQSHESDFDARGNLLRGLAIHWAGKAETIAHVLAATGLEVEIPRTDSATFVVKRPRKPRAG